jgi:hypothetical protein
MTTDKIKPVNEVNATNEDLTLESIDLFMPKESEDRVTWLNMKDAAEFIGKSHAMIKILVAQKKIKSTKVKGKYGLEVRVDAGSLKEYYKDEDNSYINPYKKDTPILTNTELKKSNPEIQHDNAYFRITEQKLDSLTAELKSKDEQIKNLEINTNKLYLEIEAKRSDQERILKLFENQQSLMLSLQQQMKTLTDAVAPTNFNASRNDQNTNQKEDYVTEVKDNSKRKKWWFF